MKQQIKGTYFVKMWLPDAELVHGPLVIDPSEPHEDPPPPPKTPDVKLKAYGLPGWGAFEGEMTFHFTPNEDGTLSGDANGTPIHSGYYTGDEFFKVDFPAGPGRWEIWARVDAEGFIEGMVSLGGGKGFPNFVYGKRVDCPSSESC